MDPLAAKQQEIESAVGQSFVLDDLPDAADVLDRDGFEPGISFIVGAGLDDRYELIAVECILGHLPISRLEDVERENNMGKQHNVWQREEAA
jgi:hypothetical protein